MGELMGINEATNEAFVALRKLQQSYLRQAESIEEMFVKLGRTPNAQGEPHLEVKKFTGCERKLALRMYFKERRGVRLHVDIVADDLLRMGLDPGEPYGSEEPAQTLIHNLKKIAKAQRLQKRDPVTFEFDPVTWEMWAAPTIDDISKPRLRSTRIVGSGSETA
jgi:hypothetical protein